MGRAQGKGCSTERITECLRKSEQAHDWYYGCLPEDAGSEMRILTLGKHEGAFDNFKDWSVT